MTQKAYAAGSEFPPYTKDTMRLYNMRFCPYTERTRLVLVHKNIPYETINVDLKKKPDWFLEKSPFGKVPVLQYNDELVFESDVCDEYLDDKYPQKPLTPKDPYTKARHRLLRDNFSKWIGLTYKLLRAEASEIQQIVNDAYTELDAVEKALSAAGKTFFGGSDPGMLDYFIWPWFERIGITEAEQTKGVDLLPKDRFPVLTRWMDDMWKTVAVKAVAFNKQTHSQFFEGHLAGTPDYDIGL